MLREFLFWKLKVKTSVLSSRHMNWPNIQKSDIKTMLLKATTKLKTNYCLRCWRKSVLVTNMACQWPIYDVNLRSTLVITLVVFLKSGLAGGAIFDENPDFLDKAFLPKTRKPWFFGVLILENPLYIEWHNSNVTKMLILSPWTEIPLKSST